mgnify:CR=1 FL=1
MAWILDEYSKFHGYSPAVVTGKPIVSSCNHGVVLLFHGIYMSGNDVLGRILVDHSGEPLPLEEE